jgi:hypothetical protein
MSNIHNNGEGDKTLDGDLNRIVRAYGSLERQQPPDLLDKAVLNSAHRAVQKKTGWMQFGWLHGLTTAAVIVLAISLVLRQQEPAPVFEETAGSQGPAEMQRAKESVVQPSLPAPLRADAEALKDDSRSRQQAVPASPVNEIQELRQTAGAPSLTASQQSQTKAQAGLRAEAVEYTVDSDKRAVAAGQPVADEAAVMIAPAEMDAGAETRRPAPLAEMVSEEKSLITRKDSAEQQLAAIIKLKEDGDDRWKTELAEFRKRYPDFPVPEELEP